MPEFDSDLERTFSVYARFGIEGAIWFEKPVSVGVFRQLAEIPTVTSSKDGLLCCPADLAGSMQQVLFDDGSMFGRRDERIIARRYGENVRSITLLLYDVENNRQRMSDLIAILKRAELNAVVFTTFSHNPEGITYIRHNELERAGISVFEADDDAIIRLATTKESKGGLGLKADRSTIRIATRESWVRGEHCVQLLHEPLYRYRIMIFFHSAFGDPSVEGWTKLSVKDRSRLWRHGYLGYASQLGINVDPACADLPHASYLPNVHPDRQHTYEWAYVDGRLLEPSLLREIAQKVLAQEEERRSSFAARPSSPHAELEEVRAALTVIPASCDYREWRNLIWAAKSAFGDTELEEEAREVLDAWSQTDDQLYDASSFDRVWSDALPEIDGGITMGTFWHVARSYGFDRAVYQRLSLI